VHALGGDFNLYAYVGGLLLKAVDPLGLCHGTDNPGSQGCPEEVQDVGGGGELKDTIFERGVGESVDEGVAATVDTVEAVVTDPAGTLHAVVTAPIKDPVGTAEAAYDTATGVWQHGLQASDAGYRAVTTDSQMAWAEFGYEVTESAKAAIALLPIGWLGRAVPDVKLRGPQTSRRIVSPPAPGQVLEGFPDNPNRATVFEGHGVELPGSFEVPEGTYIRIPDVLEIKDDIAQDMARVGTVRPGMPSTVYGPGQRAPNLVLQPPHSPELTVRASSTTVTESTLLKDLVKPNMGVCLWGACRRPMSPRAFSVEPPSN
jgi:hypothetical protein